MTDPFASISLAQLEAVTGGTLGNAAIGDIAGLQNLKDGFGGLTDLKTNTGNVAPITPVVGAAAKK